MAHGFTGGWQAVSRLQRWTHCARVVANVTGFNSLSFRYVLRHKHNHLLQLEVVTL